MQEEIWKLSSIIPKYEVSNLGRVRNYKRKNILKPKRNYEYLSIQANVGYKKYTSFKIHRLVATEFIPNPENKLYVNHLDGNKHNNCVNNLEWVTASENIRHALKNGLTTRSCGEKHYFSKFTNEDIKFIRQNYKKKDLQWGQKALAKMFNVHVCTIQRILYREYWKGVE